MGKLDHCIGLWWWWGGIDGKSARKGDIGFTLRASFLVHNCAGMFACVLCLVVYVCALCVCVPVCPDRLSAVEGACLVLMTACSTGLQLLSCCCASCCCSSGACHWRYTTAFSTYDQDITVVEAMICITVTSCHASPLFGIPGCVSLGGLCCKMLLRACYERGPGFKRPAGLWS